MGMSEDALYASLSPDTVQDGENAYRWVVECEDCDYRTRWDRLDSAEGALESHAARKQHVIDLTETEGIDLTEDADDD